jgi:Periplasmic binding protein
VMADVGSPLAPGLFQGSIDAVKAWGEAQNKAGGVACRKVVVKEWDSKITPDDSTNGTIEACRTSFAMVGTTSLFVLDPTALATCKDKAGVATGVPDIAQLATEIPHQCNATTFPINAPPGDCPYSGGVRNGTQFTGAYQYYLQQSPGLHGIFLVPKDLPSTIQSSIVGWRAAEKVGMKNDGEFGVSGADTQASYARFIQAIKDKGSTYAATGSNDVSMVKFRKEAAAQGVNTVKVWACSVACYTPNFLQSGGKDVEGTYVWLQFLPFEDAGSNATLDAFLAAIGGPSKGTSWGASAWAAADEFKAVVDKIVAQDGPNGLTRAKFLDTIKDFNGFDDGGFLGVRDQHKYSDCMVMMQVQNGKFVRVQPTEKGKFDCNPKYLTDIAIDPSTAFKG